MTWRLHGCYIVMNSNNPYAIGEVTNYEIVDDSLMAMTNKRGAGRVFIARLKMQRRRIALCSTKLKTRKLNLKHNSGCHPHPYNQIPNLHNNKTEH